jgi:recombination protein RecA
MGGWKTGSIVEVWGDTGTGKTTVAQHALYELPLASDALWICAGTEVPRRRIQAALALPGSAEEVFRITEAAVREGASLVIVDSANGLIRQKELDGDPGYVPHPQREYKEELRSLKVACKDTGGTVMFLSKPRDRERSPVRGTGISEKAMQRVHLRRLRETQDGDLTVVAQVKGGEEAHIVIHPGTGIDWAEDIFRLAVVHELVTIRGSWYRINGELVQGKKQGCEYLRENPEIAIELDERIRRLTHIGEA